MRKPVIVLKVTPKQFKALRNLAKRIHDNMNGNGNFPSPLPTMIVLLAAISIIDAAISKWGQKGNRGSHNDYLNLLAAGIKLHALLKEEAAYCMTVLNPNDTVEDQTTFLLTSGFTLKNAPTPQGVLQEVQNFRRLFPPNLNPEQVKLKWSKPLNVTSNGNVKNYSIYRNKTNNFATAEVIASKTSTSYIDSPGAGRWYYWVVPHNTSGKGVTSGVLVANIADIS